MPVELTDAPKRLNSSKIVLKWQKPRNNGALIENYKVYQRTVEDDNTTTEWKLVTSTHKLQHSFTVERGTTFEFIVTAANKCGEGLRSDSNIKRVEVSEGDFIMVNFSAQVDLFRVSLDLNVRLR